MNEAGAVYIIMGMPNSGKDTMATLLASMVEGVAISSGEEIRKSKAAADLTAQAQQAIGALIDSHHFERIMAQALERVSPERPIVLSGVTKMPDEVDWLLAELERLGRSIAGVVYLDITIETAMKRYEQRLQSEKRNDDDAKIQNRRINEFMEHTMQSIRKYRELGLLLEIDANAEVDAVIALITEEFGLPTPILAE